MTNLVAAEFLKLRTTRTAWGLLAATVAVSGLAVAGAVVAGAKSTLDLESIRGVRTILAVMANGAIFVLVLGIIISAGEYRQRTATDTFLTTPRRWKVIAAKLTVAGAMGVLFGGISAGVSMGVADLVYRIKGLEFPLQSSEVWATFGGAVLYAALFGAIGAATGSLVRNQVAAIVGWLAWFAVVEHIVVGLLPSVGRWLPFAAGAALVRAPRDSLLSPAAAGTLLVIYAALIMTSAVAGERYRDA